jgi:hypothetical protein
MMYQDLSGFQPLRSLHGASAIVEEALTDLIDKRLGGKPRASVMATYLSGIERYRALYKNSLNERVSYFHRSIGDPPGSN